MKKKEKKILDVIKKMAETRKVLVLYRARFFICPLNVPTSSLNETFSKQDR